MLLPLKSKRITNVPARSQEITLSATCTACSKPNSVPDKAAKRSGTRQVMTLSRKHLGMNKLKEPEFPNSSLWFQNQTLFFYQQESCCKQICCLPTSVRFLDTVDAIHEVFLGTDLLNLWDANQEVLMNWMCTFAAVFSTAQLISHLGLVYIQKLHDIGWFDWRQNWSGKLS